MLKNKMPILHKLQENEDKLTNYDTIHLQPDTKTARL